MKTNENIIALIACSVFFCIMSINVSAAEYNKLSGIEVRAAINDNLVGGWAYTVEGAPEGYEKGFLVILKENNEYKVQVQIGSSTLLGKNVVVKGKEISFDVMVEGDMVSVKLTAKGSAISGKSTSSQGSYTINGVKSISSE